MQGSGRRRWQTPFRARFVLASLSLHALLAIPVRCALAPELEEQAASSHQHTPLAVTLLHRELQAPGRGEALLATGLSASALALTDPGAAPHRSREAPHPADLALAAAPAQAQPAPDPAPSAPAPQRGQSDAHASPPPARPPVPEVASAPAAIAARSGASGATLFERWSSDRLAAAARARASTASSQAGQTAARLPDAELMRSPDPERPRRPHVSARPILMTALASDDTTPLRLTRPQPSTPLHGALEVDARDGPPALELEPSPGASPCRQHHGPPPQLAQLMPPVPQPALLLLEDAEQPFMLAALDLEPRTRRARPWSRSVGHLSPSTLLDPSFAGLGVAERYRGASSAPTAAARQVALALPSREQPLQVAVIARAVRGGGAQPGAAASVEQDGSGGQINPDQPRDLSEIAEKVARVLPLVYWDWDHRGEIAGRTAVRFRLNADGYVEESRLTRSSGDVHVDRESDAALLLASPFTYVPGWIELSLTFRG